MNSSNDSREGVRSALVMASGRVALQLTALAAALLLPWVMPAQEFGRFIAVVALASLGSMLVELGLSWLEMRFMAPAWRKGNLDSALQIGSTTFFLRMILDLCVSGGLAIWLLVTPRLGFTPIELVWVALWMFSRFGTTVCAAMHLPLGFRGRFVGLELARALLHLLSAGIGYIWMGLLGTFTVLALSHLLLLVVSVLLLRRSLPVHPRQFSTGLLIQNRTYLVFTAVNALLIGVQFWLPVFLVGGHLDLAEAAVLGITVQSLGLMHGLGTGVRQGLMPIIAEQNADGQERKSLAWSSLVVRLGSAAGTTALLAWLVLGPDLLNLVLPAAYSGLYQSMALAILCFVFLNAGSSVDTLLNIRGHAATSASNLALLTVLTLGGTIWVVVQSWDNGAWWVSGVYSLAAAVFAVTTQLSLGFRDRLWLPLGRPFLLVLPGLAMLPLAWSDTRWPLWSVLPIVVVYLGYVVGAQLVQVPELQRIRHALFN